MSEDGTETSEDGIEPRDGGHTDPFWDALAEDRFLLPECVDCGEAHFPPSPVCPHCHARAVEWTESDATGDLYAFTRQHRTAPGAEAPVVLGIVELDAGPRLLTRLDAAYEDLALGDRVAVEARAYEGGVDRGRLADRPFFASVPVDGG
jgi:uncharacterized OB-fold protein